MPDNKDDSTKGTLNAEGAIVNHRASINLGLSPQLKEAFLNTVPVKRPLVVDQVIRYPQWLGGFTSAEGSFLLMWLSLRHTCRDTK